MSCFGGKPPFLSELVALGFFNVEVPLLTFDFCFGSRGALTLKTRTRGRWVAGSSRHNDVQLVYENQRHLL